jgi:uncharacterized protein YggU (UPF0235/DUF167 family)
MKIQVKVKTRSKIEKVKLISEGLYVVSVNTPPIEGRANERVLELLAEHFDVAKSKVSLLKGQKSKIKLFEVG